MEHKPVLIIIGPTCVGKTSVAFEVARRMGGEVINLDKMFLFRHFPISSGLADTQKERDVKKYLYELLEPDEPIIPPMKYVEMIKDKINIILAKGRLPIIEGGSTTYAPLLLEENKKSSFCSLVIGLKFPPSFDVRKKILQRVDLSINEGLISEVESNLVVYRNTFIMQNAYFVVPIVKYLDKKISLKSAKEEIADLCVNYVQVQMELFEKYRGIKWLDYEQNLFSETVSAIMSEVNNFHSS